MPDVAQEAMEALLVLHRPEKIEMWNPEAPINTFWDVSSQVRRMVHPGRDFKPIAIPIFFCISTIFSKCTFYSLQVLFSISQKLIQHLIVNYTDILKWLREILVCRNLFLTRHKDYANVGSHIAICRQAHIKLEVIEPSI